MIRTVKRDAIKAIHKKCDECKLVAYCSKCPLGPWSNRADAKRTDIFKENDKDRFFKDVLRTAKMIPKPFWWSSLRLIVMTEPLHPNWWGQASKMLKAEGFYIRNDLGVRSSLYRSRRGGKDLCWDCKVNIKRPFTKEKNCEQGMEEGA